MEKNRNLNFDNIQEFLAYFKKIAQTTDLSEFPKLILDQQKLKLETATFHSEIKEVKEFSEKAIKELKEQLIRIFRNENYKTLTLEKDFSPRYLEFAKLLTEYETLYITTLKKKQLFEIENSKENLVSEYQASKGSKTKEMINEMFENFDEKGWGYAFENENDYKTFVDLLSNFFEYKNYTIPKNIIRLKRMCKTKLAKLLGEIHKESSENKLRNDIQFFKIIRVLNHFQNETEQDLYKALTR